MDGPDRNCEGTARRDFLKLGIGAFIGLGFVDLIQQRVMAKQAALAAGGSSPANVNCILIWLDGRPSHYESFDPKPDAPTDIRGDLKPIKTAVPGVQFCEVIPKLAKTFDKYTVIRSVCHKDPNHGGGNHYMMTGAPTPVPVGCGAFVTFHPSYGSVVSWNRGIRNGLPAYISAPQMSRSGGPNFLGAQHAPFIIQGSPNSKDFRVRDVVLPPEISSGRAQTRQRLLLCRRLVEVGVSFITCYSGGWDHHTNIFTAFKGSQMANLDQGISALISDLDQRGMLESTLVFCLGEFGRTPKVNKDAGRDHWPHAMSILAAGSGIPRGAVIGATDAKGYYASENVHSPEDFAATLYTKMGIDPHLHLYTNTGRPVQLVAGGNPIKELFA